MKTVITAPDTVWTQDLDQQCKAMIYTSYNYSAVQTTASMTGTASVYSMMAM